jgi:hypothetical protein
VRALYNVVCKAKKYSVSGQFVCPKLTFFPIFFQGNPFSSSYKCVHWIFVLYVKLSPTLHTCIEQNENYYLRLNRKRVACVYGVTDACEECWENTREACKTRGVVECFTRFSLLWNSPNIYSVTSIACFYFTVAWIFMRAKEQIKTIQNFDNVLMLKLRFAMEDVKFCRVAQF